MEAPCFTRKRCPGIETIEYYDEGKISFQESKGESTIAFRTSSKDAIVESVSINVYLVPWFSNDSSLKAEGAISFTDWCGSIQYLQFGRLASCVFSILSTGMLQQKVPSYHSISGSLSFIIIWFHLFQNMDPSFFSSNMASPRPEK